MHGAPTPNTNPLLFPPVEERLCPFKLISFCDREVFGGFRV